MYEFLLETCQSVSNDAAIRVQIRTDNEHVLTPISGQSLSESNDSHGDAVSLFQTFDAIGRHEMLELRLQSKGDKSATLLAFLGIHHGSNRS